mmetsp:Transcript_125084/g.286598  ORF Transcript_125084/g.286598 Transcript_125084/m.286598 type:complete len:279 (+) Transcript_125084:401-1237(+)
MIRLKAVLGRANVALAGMVPALAFIAQGWRCDGDLQAPILAFGGLFVGCGVSLWLLLEALAPVDGQMPWRPFFFGTVGLTVLVLVGPVTCPLLEGLWLLAAEGALVVVFAVLARCSLEPAETRRILSWPLAWGLPAAVGFSVSVALTAFLPGGLRRAARLSVFKGVTAVVTIMGGAAILLIVLAFNSGAVRSYDQDEEDAGYPQRFEGHVAVVDTGMSEPYSATPADSPGSALALLDDTGGAGEFGPPPRGPVPLDSGFPQRDGETAMLIDKPLRFAR